MKKKTTELNDPEVMRFAREWLARESSQIDRTCLDAETGRVIWTNNGLSKICIVDIITSSDYNWFGCENDEQLQAEIVKIAKGERTDDLVETLEVMLYG